MGDSLARQVLQFCQKHNLLVPGDRVVVGVSGGLDSLCLLHLLKSLAPGLNLSLTVAHLNHQLRGADSQADADFVRTLAGEWELPVMVESRPVALLAEQYKQSLEEAARQVRYAFLWRVAVRVGADKIAVAHHADDQVETVLMHFLRGSGLAGLRGMLPAMDITELGLVYDLPDPVPLRRSSPHLIRPLLEAGRPQLETYAQAHELVPRQDLSNEDITFFRNRLRHELIPYLETYNPNLREIVRRTAAVVAAETEILDEHLDKAWRFIVQRETPGRIEFHLADWKGLPLAMKRASLRRAIQRLSQGLRDIGFEHIEKAIDIIGRGSTGTRAVLPRGIKLTVSYDTVMMTAKSEPPPVESEVPYLGEDEIVKIVLPGMTPLPGTPWQLRAEFIIQGNLTRRQVSQVGQWETYLDADAAIPDPVLRRRRPGDRFFPLGLEGHSQKVNEFMINEKIPATRRDSIPLLVSGDRILWICGYRLDQHARLRATTQRGLYLRFERR